MRSSFYIHRNRKVNIIHAGSIINIVVTLIYYYCFPETMQRRQGILEVINGLMDSDVSTSPMDRPLPQGKFSFCTVVIKFDTDLHSKSKLVF